MTTINRIGFVALLLIGSTSAFAQNVNNNSIPEIVKDIEGNVYHTVVVGKQVWLQENLRTRKYRNGKAIASKLTKEQWSKNTTGACAVYEKIGRAHV